MYADHTIVSCATCGSWYDMDFEEPLDDQHGYCYSEDWLIFLIPHLLYPDCGCNLSPDPKPEGYWVNLLAEKT